MSQIKYQFGAIETAAGDINSTSGRITQMLGDLKSQIQPMTATWEGESPICQAGYSRGHGIRNLLPHQPRLSRRRRRG
ncbi:WXG100 family type VII secretion target [Corynebacterium halotolerans]|uniref:WXG100 family type VII secretion target n=1 Tax=Corynebacterium halotolerans TaxID=225326 RepID=UPI003CECD117